MYQAGVTSWALLSCLLALTRTTDTTNTAGLSSTAAAFRAFRSSHHDGTWRSVDIATKETLNSFQGVSGAGVVYYHGEQEATARGASWSAGRHMLEVGRHLVNNQQAIAVTRNSQVNSKVAANAARLGD